MSDDLRALLAAIVADPADDTARLVYADCLQEHGNTARADFIRLQVEAEHHHPDSAKRAELEAQAEALFAEHWIDWWGEVCAAVGWAAPVPQPAGTFRRLAGRLGLSAQPGYPYYRDGFGVRLNHSEFVRADFHRGFPEAVHVTMGPPMVLRVWDAVSPLTALIGEDSVGAEWDDSPHLAGVRSLTLGEFDPAVLLAVLNSPQLDRLEELRLFGWPTYFRWQRELLPGELDWIVASPRVRQLKRLGIPVWTAWTAETLASAEPLSGLEALEVHILVERRTQGEEEERVEQERANRAAAGERLATLARSPHLSGLRELKVVGGLDANGVAAVIRNPVWKRLRKLELDAQFWYDPFIGSDDLPELEELRVSEVRYDTGSLPALVRSPLLKRLRHFAMRGHYPGGALLSSLVHAVDTTRIETFALGVREVPTQVVELLRSRLGDRLRLLT